jgi:hypothetical protein
MLDTINFVVYKEIILERRSQDIFEELMLLEDEIKQSSDIISQQQKWRLKFQLARGYPMLMLLAEEIRNSNGS